MNELMKKLGDFIESEPYDVIRVSWSDEDGEIYTYEPKEQAWCQNTYSVSKTFTMAAIGILYDKGLVKVEDKICDILADYVPENIPDKRWYDVTIEQLLTHSAGLPEGFLDIDVHKISEFTDDFVKYSFNHELVYNPGEDSKYSDGAFYLLALAAEKISGEVTDNFLWKELFSKLDFQEAAWSHCPKGHVMGGTGLYINSYDMVKLGIVFLNGGMYKGRRIFSEEWVNMAVEKEYGLDYDREKNYFYKGGMNGQKLAMIPAKKRAVAVQSFGANSGRITDFLMEN